MNEQNQPSAPKEPMQPFRVEPSIPVPDDSTGDQTRILPHLGTPAPPPSSTTPAHPLAQRYGQSSPLVTVRRGPLPMTVMLGLLSIIVAAFVFVKNATGADVDLRVAGPITFGALGGLLLIVGLVGVVMGGRRHHD